MGRPITALITRGTLIGHTLLDNVVYQSNFLIDIFLPLLSLHFFAKFERNSIKVSEWCVLTKLTERCIPTAVHSHMSHSL